MHPLGPIIFLLIPALQAASQEAPGAATTAPSTDTAAPSTETVVTVPISQYPFSAFPLPSQTSVAGVFPLTDPREPPPVGSSVVPDFEHAWAGAYQEAINKVSLGAMPRVSCAGAVELCHVHMLEFIYSRKTISEASGSCLLFGSAILDGSKRATPSFLAPLAAMMILTFPNRLPTSLSRKRRILVLVLAG